MVSKIFIFGLDSATFDIIFPLIREGQLPNLARMMNEGCYGILQSTIPPHSAPAWITFMTGENPGKHGAYGFRTYDLTKYTAFDENLVNSSLFRGKTIFDYLSKLNKKVVAFTIPLTYPPWPINGVMVAGYPTPDERKAFTYPPEIGKELEPLTDLKIDRKLASSIETQIKSYRFENDQLTKGIIKLLKKDRFDLFAFVTGILDSAQHTLWRYRNPQDPFFDEEKHRKYGHLIEDLYIMLDESLGKILEYLDEDTHIFIVSDHGAGPRPIKFFNTNFFLLKNGYLSLRNPVKRYINKKLRIFAEWAKEHLPIRDWVKKKLSAGLKEKISGIRSEIGSIVWRKTKAYRIPFYYPYDGINLNVKGRQPEGIVDPNNEYETLRNEIIEKLSNLNGQFGEKIILEIYKKEEIYNGPFLDRAPDIIFRVNENYDLGPGFDSLIEDVPKSLLSGNSGYHRMEGIFIAKGPNIEKKGDIGKAEMLDIAPTVLYCMGLPIPKNMDGKVLDIFTEEYKRKNKIQYTDHVIKIKAAETEKVDIDEKKEIERALKGLGYL